MHCHGGNQVGLIDPTIKTVADRSGATPLALARGRGYREMVLMLEAAGAR